MDKQFTKRPWEITPSVIEIGNEKAWAIRPLDEKDNDGFVIAMTYGPDAEGNAERIAGAVNIYEMLVTQLTKAERGYRNLVELGVLPYDWDDVASRFADGFRKVLDLTEEEDE